MLNCINCLFIIFTIVSQLLTLCAGWHFDFKLSLMH